MKLRVTHPLLAALLGVVFTSEISAQTSAFTYQGRLSDNGQPATGLYDLIFSLHDASTEGNQVGSFLTNDAVAIRDGLFTVTLDFGNGVFAGAERWLQAAVRTNGGGVLEALIPRVRVTSTPYAIRAEHAGMAVSAAGAATVPWNGISGVPPTLADGVDDDTTYGAGQGLSLSGPILSLNTDFTDGRYWRLGGNAGITPGAQFLGTTDQQPLELWVNNLRALRLEDNGDGSDAGTTRDGAPNIIGGSPGNVVEAGVVGATIGGGGATNYRGSASGNAVLADYGTVGGGLANRVETGATAATVSGGYVNTIESDAKLSVIAGGELNTIGTNTVYSAIGGGRENTIGTNSGSSTISGGEDNAIGARSWYATIAGGDDNTIETYAKYSAISGGYANTIAAKAEQSTIGGGLGNDIEPEVTSSAIGGGIYNTIGTNSNASVIAGGAGNAIGSRAYYSTISGGTGNKISADARFATIPGGSYNVATNYAFAAGNRAKANHAGAFVWADSMRSDFASTASNQFLIRATGGVGINTANLAARLTVAGAGPFNNLNAAAVVLDNTAANRQWQWHVLDNGNVQWADRTAGLTRLLIDTDGDVGIGTINPTERLHVAGNILATGTVTGSSDRNVKENFAPVVSRQVLEKVAALPIQRWNYIGEATPHLGPVAQDFHESFQVGMDDKHISMVDADGVALAAIQGLNQKVDERSREEEARIEELEARSWKLEAENAELKRELAALQQLINSLAQSRQGAVDSNQPSELRD